MYRQIALHHHVTGENAGQCHLRAQSRARQQRKQKQIAEFQEAPRSKQNVR
jgi:hypothetical protein